MGEGMGIVCFLLFVFYVCLKIRKYAVALNVLMPRLRSIHRLKYWVHHEESIMNNPAI